MKKQKVTVVTITYNAEKFLEKTIKSVISQKYDNIEYIIIDGGSDDDTVEIIKKYSKYINYWISESDKGLYDAMNKGIDIATGDWINFMNAGDIFYDENTILNISNMFDNGAQIICGDILRGKNYSEYGKTLGLDYAYDSVFVNHQASYTEMSLMKKFKFDSSMRISSDYGFFFRCYINGYKFKFINEPLAKSMEGGVSQTNNILTWAEAMHLQAKYLENTNDIFKHKFYDHLVNTPTHNQFFLRLLNNLDQKLKELLSGKQFVLYGFGSIGELVYNKYKKNIIMIVDNNHLALSQDKKIAIVSTNELSKVDDEYVLISSFGYENEIKKTLINKYQFDKSKILEVTISRVHQC